MSVKYNPLTRRQFLSGLGGYTLALPLLPSLLPSVARALPAPNKRFISFSNGHSQHKSYWPDPEQIPGMSDLFLDGKVFVKEKNLADMGSMQSIGKPFKDTRFNDQIRSKTTILRGLDHLSPAGGGHNSAHLSTSQGPHPSNPDLHESMDVFLTRSSNFYPTDPIAKALRFMGSSSFEQDGGNIVRIASEGDPQLVYDNYFKPFLSDNPSAPDPKVVKQHSIMEMVLGAYNSVRQSRRISSVDKQRLDKHMEFIAATEQRLQNSINQQSGGLGCGNTGNNIVDPQSVGVDRRSNYEDRLNLMIDMLIVGAICGVSRVYTVDFESHSGAGPFDWMGYRFHNQIIHNTVEAEAWSNLEAANIVLPWYEWNFSHIAKVVSALDNHIDDPENSSNTALDNSLVFYDSESGVSDYMGSHSNRNCQAILFGSAGGYLNRTGRYLSYQPTFDGYNGRYTRYYPRNQLLFSMLEAMGLSPSEFQTSPDGGFGLYGNLTPGHAEHLANGRRGQGLPFLRG